MASPQPLSVATRLLSREDIVAFIRRVRFAHLATRGLKRGATVRPLEIDTISGRDLYFYTYDTSAKILELAGDAHVCIVWTDFETLSQVRMFATVYLEQDEEVIERFRAAKPLLPEMLPTGAEGLFALYRVEPDRVQSAEGIAPYRRVLW